MLRTLLLFAIALLAPAAPAQDAPKTVYVIHCGALLDEPGQAPRSNATIIVREGAIDDVLDG